MKRRRRGRGGKNGHEPRVRVRQREQTVVRLATQGRSQQEIAREVGVTQAAVSRILQRVDDRWLRENVDWVARHKADQTRKLDHLFREALRAWECSKAQRTRRRQRKTGGGDQGLDGTMAEVIVDDSHGDPRYLEAARRTLQDRARLWGALAADPTASVEADSDEVFTLNIADRHPPQHGDGGQKPPKDGRS